MSDDHDADAISAYGKQPVATRHGLSLLINTPNLDRIAKDGIWFTSCFVGNSICSAVRATVLTGQHSHLNGIKDNRTPSDGSKTTHYVIPHIGIREKQYKLIYSYTANEWGFMT